MGEKKERKVDEDFSKVMRRRAKLEPISVRNKVFFAVRGMGGRGGQNKMTTNLMKTGETKEKNGSQEPPMRHRSRTDFENQSERSAHVKSDNEKPI